mmetsp:Transcript_22908/g.45110  ORF Transcript_22908/g.45110 Transcript_22908/m.45110 type:complete len:93 (-) Transcript_22908:419-697(-)
MRAMPSSLWQLDRSKAERGDKTLTFSARKKGGQEGFRKGVLEGHAGDRTHFSSLLFPLLACTERKRERERDRARVSSQLGRREEGSSRCVAH